MFNTINIIYRLNISKLYINFKFDAIEIKKKILKIINVIISIL